MNKLNQILIVVFSIILIIISFCLVNYLHWFIIIPLCLSLFAMYKTRLSSNQHTKTQIIENESRTDSNTEETEEILGLKVKSGVHTKILRKIEPQLDTLKANVFWPFVPPKSKLEDISSQRKDFKYCKECGSKISRNAKFCQECGKNN